MRTEADSERNTVNHNTRTETLDGPNLFRESSVNSRADEKQGSMVLAERFQRINELQGEIETPQTRSVSLRNLLSSAEVG